MLCSQVCLVASPDVDVDGFNNIADGFYLTFVCLRGESKEFQLLLIGSCSSAVLIGGLIERRRVTLCVLQVAIGRMFESQKTVVG